MNLQQRIDEASETLRAALASHPSAAFATSFGAEDMVLLDLIDRLGLAVDAFTLDTGRLHDETYALMARARERYPRTPVRVLFPDAGRIEAWVAEHGINGFRDSVELRKGCCGIRKLEPLARALKERELWITGLRREQSPTRAAVAVLERDEANGLMKLNPLADWSSADVLSYVATRRVPVNALHALGYPSIGCAPCTRAVASGEDERAGRWWWEQPLQRECGLHVGADGRLVRSAGTATNNDAAPDAAKRITTG
ncbi:MAG TPA: phosphoadenylyl-sulfate reductase [Quisquiliibacterium sp.]|nr:phosphoadenylyl-sulfate reductase [Quisquiliibacterium sp.]